MDNSCILLHCLVWFADWQFLLQTVVHFFNGLHLKGTMSSSLWGNFQHAAPVFLGYRPGTQKRLSMPLCPHLHFSSQATPVVPTGDSSSRHSFYLPISAGSSRHRWIQVKVLKYSSSGTFDASFVSSSASVADKLMRFKWSMKQRGENK